MINAGWEEREAEDAELRSVLDGRGVNASLYGRAVEALAGDRDLRVAIIAHRTRHAELRAFYGIRLQAAWDTVFAVMRRPPKDDVAAGARRSAVQALRDVDDWYAYEVARIVETTATSQVVQSSEALARQRREVAEIVSGAAVVAIAGGHVGILMETLRLLDVAIPPQTPVIAWSAGAMAVCDPVVLFHDFAPQGVTAPEVHDRGLGRLRGIVPLPHARRRLALEDRDRMALFANRFPGHRLVPLDDGTIVRFSVGDSSSRPAVLPEGARFVDPDGAIAAWEPA